MVVRYAVVGSPKPCAGERHEDIVWAEPDQGVLGLAHAFGRKLCLTKELVDDVCVPANLAATLRFAMIACVFSLHVQTTPVSEQQLVLFPSNLDFCHCSHKGGGGYAADPPTFFQRQLCHKGVAMSAHSPFSRVQIILPNVPRAATTSPHTCFCWTCVCACRSCGARKHWLA